MYKISNITYPWTGVGPGHASGSQLHNRPVGKVLEVKQAGMTTMYSCIDGWEIELLIS